MIRRAAGLLLAAVLVLPWAAPARAADADTDTVEMVEAFLKMPTAELPPEHIPRFLAVDPAALPKKLRRPYEARRLELYTLKQLGQTRKKGNIITPEDHCEAPKDAKSQDISLLMKVGYVEITEEEKDWLTHRTHCTEQDMLCEFTLQILDEKVGSGPKARKRRRYFLFCGAGCDPLMVLVGVYRARVKDPNTNFFGTGAGPVCSR
ncbi:MAG: hypothetical protein NTY77_17315 [Elusimicrobia bacterium]|nr:hypothetical protein [Elusimicrobiota bacterium]